MEFLEFPVLIPGQTPQSYIYDFGKQTTQITKINADKYGFQFSTFN
jgi:hypothetical protein